MEDKQKVYIKGVQGRGSEVIKALDDLGGRNGDELFSAENDDYIYYINHKGYINCEHTDSETAQIIMDNYREIKLQEKWSDGNILVRKDNNNLFCVYQKPADNGKGFLCHVYVSKDTLFTGVTVPTEAADNYRRATDAEELAFYALITYHHLCWDAENKVLVSWGCHPNCGQKYYSVSNYGTVVDATWCDSSIDKNLLRAGNWFLTKEEAETAAERVKKALKRE